MIERNERGFAMLKPAVLSFSIILVVLCLFASGFAQQTAPSSVPSQEAVGSAVDQALTYLDTAAMYLGQGVLYLLNLITGDRVSSGLEKPIGYLSLITVILILFGLLDVAKRIIWIGIVVGWVLLIVRIILDALNV